MKQIFREMKLNLLVSILRSILLIGGMGGFLLFMQRDILMQLLGFKPKADEISGTDLGICVMAGGMLLFAVYLLLRALSGSAQKNAKEFVSKLDNAQKERLVLDYQNAWRGSRTFRVGQIYTFVLDAKDGIYLNSEIVWLQEWNETVIKYGVSHKYYYFNLYLLHQEEPKILNTTEKMYPQILEYYERHFPHIVAGDSDEARYLYRTDRNQFLHLKYYTKE